MFGLLIAVCDFEKLYVEQEARGTLKAIIGKMLCNVGI